MQNGLIKELVAAARKRWVMLLVGFGLLAILFIFAGMIRTPGARKNPYTVIASRALAVAGALLLMRIILLTHEDGLPVFMIEASGLGDESVTGALDLLDRRFDIVPLADVTQFVREQRYVPRNGAAVVIRVTGKEALGGAREALSAGTAPPVTLLFAEEAAGWAGGALEGGFPEDVTLGVEVAARAGETLDEDEAIARLKTICDRIGSATGKTPAYAMLPHDGNPGLGKIAKEAGIEAFFGGDGLNRYGDRGNRIRLADITPLLASRRLRSTRLKTFATMYRGNYLPYPTWVWLNMAAPMAAGGGRG